MERPVYHLKGVMKDGADTRDFTGPLDLILHLLKKNKLAIRDIPLAALLEQFLAWMSARRAMDLEVAGEFIAMASQLTLLKTRMLLSQEDDETKNEWEALIASLEARQRQENGRRAGELVPWFAEAFGRGQQVFTKGPEKQYARRVYCYRHPKEDLPRAVLAWQSRVKQGAPPTVESFRAVVRPEPYRVEQKAAELLGLLEETGPLALSALLSRSRSRSEATAAFLALLELCRGGRLHLSEGEDPVMTLRSPPPGGTETAPEEPLA